MTNTKENNPLGQHEINTIRLGVLGGGQLGKMLALAAGNWHLPMYFLDKDPSFPAARFAAHFEAGDFNLESDVLRFGQMVDVLTIEIEHVHLGALHQLQASGLTIHPSPDVLETIKDKGLQKLFYAEHEIPTAPFVLYESYEAVLDALKKGTLKPPFVQKTRTDGYDGRGVAIIRTSSDYEKLIPGGTLIETIAPIEKELAVLVARNERGEIKAYPTVEMDFNPEANLVEFLICPARIDQELEARAEKLAIQVIEAFGVCGLLAVEMFLTQDGALWVNEVAPRPHNSGHHTIDSCTTSQFEQHIRAVLNLPLGDTRLHTPAVMVNLLGAPGFSGLVHYEGLSECLAIPGVHLHLYGKDETRPFRKMGHATIVAPDLGTAIDRAEQVRDTLRILSK
ncbi:MAG: 5-(carboxyamino)imidazole ribonucleotide synthase [Haliscomenobacter sp.]